MEREEDGPPRDQIPFCGGDDAEPAGTDGSQDNAGNDEDDHKVGYKRPPKEHQFPPKKSGNPRGRPKGAKGVKAIVKKELSARVRITENGKSRTISKFELMIKRLVEKGGKGDYKSIAKLIDLGALVFGMDDEDHNAPVLTPQEQAIIDVAAKRRRTLAEKSAGASGRRKPKSPSKSHSKPGPARE